MDSINNFENILRKNNVNFIETKLQPFLAIPSHTLNRDGILKTKDYIISYISEFCEEIDEYHGEINPLILAKVNGDIRTPLLIYMMYDTQPVHNDKGWISEPFNAEVHVLPPPLDILGNCIVARGAYNSKTPLLSFLNIVKELKARDHLPISLQLLFDGEEEIGSPSLLRFLKEKKKLLKYCTGAYYPSTKQNLNGNSVIKLGYKGILSLSIKVSTQNKEPHSAFSAMIPNPTTDLISLINTIFSNNELHIESLRKPYKITDEEKSLFENIKNAINFDDFKKKAGIIKTREDNPYLAFKNYLFNPTFNISTLKSGFLDEGSKNYVPNEAICNLDIRFAHKVNVDEILQEIKEKIEDYSKTLSSKVEITNNIGYESSRIKKDSPLVKSLIESAKILGVKTEIWPFSAAAAPLSQIQEILGIDFITGGLGIGGYAHSANEFIQYHSIINTRLSYYHFLKIYAKIVKK
ncbi:MAG: M20/M25/M40 family metallo-hydrolase [Promethearchaeota archaeon]|jgi:acetylornithine deacetylase/succinyl-diaminopimelate desuccinylase-like protein